MDNNAILLLLKVLNTQKPSEKTEELEMLLQEALERDYLLSSWKKSAAQAAIKAKWLEQKLIEVLADQHLLNSDLKKMLQFLDTQPFSTFLQDPEETSS